jgi:two-component system cell cycle sensor histidine kinase/response regulator CckA
MKDEQLTREELLSEVRRLSERLRELESSDSWSPVVEDELRQSERYRLLIETIPHAIEEIDRSGKITFGNSAYFQLMGYEQQHIIGKRIWEFVESAEEKDRLRNHLAMLLRDQPTPTPYFQRNRTKDGRIVDFKVDWNYRRDKMGRVQGFISVLSDITERSQALHQLNKERNKIQSYLDIASAIVLSLNSGGEVTLANKKLRETLGMKQEDLVGKNWFENFLPKRFRGLVDNVFTQMMAGETEPVEYFENPILTSTGEERLIAWHNVLLTDDTGKPVGTLSSGLDITEKQQALEALSQSEEKYRTLFRESTDAILIIHPDGKIIDANPSCCLLFGSEQHEVVGSDVHQFYRNPEDLDLFRKEAERNGFVRDFDWRVRRKDGSLRLCLLTSSAWLDSDGATIGYFCIARDITESKRLEEQLLQSQKMEAVGILAGGIAHDFNNLLHVMLGYTDIALSELQEGQAGYRELQQVTRAAVTAAELTEGLLTFSRRVESKLRPVNVNLQILQIAKMLQRTIPKMINIELNLADNLRTVTADPGQMQQVILNLAVNAKDAMPNGGDLIVATKNIYLDEEYCRTHLGTKSGDYVLLTVTDTGTGMDKKTLEHVFEPFFTTKDTGKGTGLGLSIVYGMVKNHDGNILCYSEPGEGTTFKIYLPAIVASGQRAEPAMIKAIPVGSETILLVDDEDAVRRLGEQILSKFGYTVLTAGNGLEGLDVYRRERDRIALVILDLIMPKMSGAECLKEILTIDPQAKVIVASGYAANGQIVQAIEDGAKASIQKPYGAQSLVELVRRILDDESRDQDSG